MRRSVGATIKLILVLSFITPVIRVVWGPLGRGSVAVGSAPVSSGSLSLDGVMLELTTSFLSDLTFTTSDPDSAIQMATAEEVDPLLRQLSITAVPFGTSSPTESLPAAGAGVAEAYRAGLKAYRERQGGDPHDGAVMRLFGEDVSGSTSVVRLRVRGENPRSVAITEWVAEAGPRLWIVRAVRELRRTSAWRPPATAAAFSFADSALSSGDLYRPSTSLAAIRYHGPLRGNSPGVTGQAPDLPFPAWWVGECDTVNFYAATGAPAYPLGAEYRGMKACGPRPWADGGPWRWVSFGPGLMSQIEWQCPELSKRFLYLAHGIPPYAANGNQMVDNYDGDLLEKVWNCTAGRAPEPDDVLSYGRYTTYGHTSVVIASDVDAAGDGTIDVIEQNSSSDGDSRLYVDNWCVTSYTDVIGWLHKPDDEPSTGWVVEYYSDDHLGDACNCLTQEGSYVFGNWGSAAPAAGCPSDYFSARFSRTLDFPGGEYTFGLGYDRGARLEVDGETVIDGWETPGEHYETRYLEAGLHEVRVAYREDVGDAYVTAFWWGPGFGLARESRDNGQWYGQYWGNQTLWWDPIVTLNEGGGFLDHHWVDLAPQDGLPADHFSARFERTVPFDAGRWRFVVAADDGTRLWMDDELIVDEWQDQVATFRQEVDVTEGDHALRIEHYENGGWAFIRLSWEWVPVTTTLSADITSPTEGATITTCPLTIEAQASDPISGVKSVAFYAAYDHAWHHLGDDDSQPYRWEWDCSAVGKQGVWLAIHVWDDADNEVVDPGGHVYVRLRPPSCTRLPLMLKGH